MQLNFKGEIVELEMGIQILSKELGFEISKEGIEILVEKRSGNIELALENGKGIIRYDRIIHFFRALGLFIEALQDGDSFKIYEEPQFTMNGAMFDVSRNSVMTVGSVKKMIRKMAVMGLDMIMLYTEDIYTVEDEPYFGYMRGRYTSEELKECDNYAYIFGIEMIPCIQTLGHMTEYLKWEAAANVRDNAHIMLAGSEETYQLIDKMIKAASLPFRSKRIHIGMDEANDLGLGNYLKINGYQRRFDIMNNHLREVLKITSNYGLKPMMWSDMYFKLGAKVKGDYDLNADIPEDIIENMPKDVQFVYWDYYHDEEGFYRECIKKHKRFGSMPVFAGGIWTWFGFGTNYGKTFVTTNSALNVCKQEGVKEVFATIWMNNGSSNNFFSSLLGLQLFAEHGYSKELDLNKLMKRFEFCTGAKYESFMDLKLLDEIPGTNPENLECSNPSKFLLWQDVLMGLFDKHIEGLAIDEHYRQLEEKMLGYSSLDNEWRHIFEVAAKLCGVLKLKGTIGMKLKENYEKRNMDGLRSIMEDKLPELSEKIKDMRDAHRKQWFMVNKPFGWEYADMQYGSILSRIDTAIYRLKMYMDGWIDKIDELEEERLYFDGKKRAPGETQLTKCNSFKRIITAGGV